MPISHEFVFGSLLTVYLVGWSAGFAILSFKQLFEKI